MLAPQGGWLHLFGKTMIIAGIIGTFLIIISALRQDRGRGLGRR